jgi:tRNA modification GTPase
MDQLLKDLSQSTIAAVATPPGKGGISVIRVSGPLTARVIANLLHCEVKPRQANYLPFYANDGQVIDQGVAIYFNGPHSFTGEDVLELQGHGGPIIMDMLLEAVLECGVYLAKPGEFSERAFHNDKLDLAQAEAISDLIDCGSRQAAKSALRSLTGEFSTQVHQLLEMVIYLRIYVEAAIDFPEEEIDFLQDSKVTKQTSAISSFMSRLLANAEQGSLLREGMKIVIAGKPNAGKSSLLNALAGKETAIVTDIEGTTRDVLTEQISIDGLPLHIVDTAGLRDAKDQVEKIGIQRAAKEIENADRVLLVVDASQQQDVDVNTEITQYIDASIELPPITLILNKIDLTSIEPKIDVNDKQLNSVSLSASSGQGIDLLRQHLKSSVGFEAAESGTFMARRRHVDALKKAQSHINEGFSQLSEFAAGELLAEELKLAQDCLNEITGEFTSDDLLGKIFTSFCIGK